jgi:hypothetical protein
MSNALKHAIEEGLINETTHERLLSDLPHWARQAGIPEKFVFSSVYEFCTDEEEIKYVSSLLDPESQPIGMMYIGKVGGASINDRMMAIAGVCLRNYINAKVMTVQDVITNLREGDMPSPTVLLIPNFFLSSDNGGRIPEWLVSGLLGLLYKRQQEDKQTVLYISSIPELKSEYGPAFIEHINGKFVPITQK